MNGFIINYFYMSENPLSISVNNSHNLNHYIKIHCPN